MVGGSRPRADRVGHWSIPQHGAQVPGGGAREGIVRDGPAPDEERLSRLASVSQSGPRRVDTPSGSRASNGYRLDHDSFNVILQSDNMYAWYICRVGRPPNGLASIRRP